MNRGRTWTFIACMVAFLGAFTSTNAFPEARGVTGDTVRIGNITVKTGPVAPLGLPGGWGVQDAFSEVNDKGGINGRKISFIWEDDQFKTPLAISAFNKLIFRDKVMSLVMCGGTPQTVALFDPIDKQHVVVFPNGLAEEMYNPYRPYIFCLGATYATQIELMFDYIMNDLKAKDPKIAVVYCETEFGKKGLEASRKCAQYYGLKLVSELVLGLGAVDASSEVLSLKKDHVDYVITCTTVPAVITFLKTAEKYDYWPITFGVNWSCDDTVVRACKASAKNYVCANCIGGWEDDTPGMKRVRELAKKNGRDPSKMLTSLYTTFVGYATVYAEGLKRAGKDLSPESFKDALETLKEFDTGGIIPPVTFTSTSHAPSRASRLYRPDLEKGVLVPITDFRVPKELK